MIILIEILKFKIKNLSIRNIFKFRINKFYMNNKFVSLDDLAHKV